MDNTFPNIMSRLRREKGLSQRKAAADLKISQALLSHYENGAREPGLDFIRRAAGYYGVSSDYLLGLEREGGSNGSAEALSRLVLELDELCRRAHKTLEELGK